MKHRIIALVSNKEHVAGVLARFQKSQDLLLFVCLSQQAFNYCTMAGLNVKAPCELPGMSEADFWGDGLTLSRIWTNSALSLLGDSPRTGLGMLYSTRFNFFFSAAIFGLALARAIGRLKDVELVLLPEGGDKTIIGDSLDGSGQLGVVSTLCASHLREIPVATEYITESCLGHATVSHGGQHKCASEQRGIKYLIKMRCPRLVLAAWSGTWSARCRIKKFLAAFRWRFWQWRIEISRRICKHKLLLFWGTGVDSVYQELVAAQCKRLPGIKVIRVESRGSAFTGARSTTSWGYTKQGLDMTAIYRHFGFERKSNNPWMGTNPGEPAYVIAQAQDCLPREMSADEGLLPQFEAMVREIHASDASVSNLQRILSKLKPDAVVTSCSNLICLACQANGIPSFTLPHGIIVTPLLTALLGDFNLVAGDSQRCAYTIESQHLGTLMLAGFPGIRSLAAEGKPQTNRKVVTFLPYVSPYITGLTNMNVHSEICHAIGEVVRRTGSKLIVKVHPRYGQQNIGTYKEIFQAKDINVEFNAENNLAEVLTKTDVLVSSELTSGVWEALAARVPVLLAIFHMPWHEKWQACLFGGAASSIGSARGVPELQSIMSSLLTSGSFKQFWLSRQEGSASSLCCSWGVDAAKKSAELILSSLNSRECTFIQRPVR